MEKKRNISLDYAKGVAMLSIVIGHLYFYSDRYQGALAYAVCDTIQIPVFMYISGLLAHISIDRDGFRKMIVSKVIRLLFPFVSFCIVWALLEPSKADKLLFDEFKRGYWFLPVLFELMVVLSFVRRVFAKFGIKSYITNGAIYAALTLYLYLVPRDNVVNTLFSINLFWHYYPFFMLGYYYWKIERFVQIRFVPVYLVLYAVSFYFYFEYGMKAMKAPCNLFSLLLLMSTFQRGYMVCRDAFAQVGLYSLQVYMIQFFLIIPLAGVLPAVENRWLEFPYFAAVASVVIAVSIAISKLLMKNGWLAMLLFGVKRKKG